jgi:1-acyl-sn-glycerol-3-phosphate acyltransferase
MIFRQPLARFVVATGFVGALADWTLFATMVVTVDRLLGSTPWATALVLIVRIVPGVVFAPLAARRIDRADLRRSLVGHEIARLTAVTTTALGVAARSVGVVVAGLLLLEFAAAMQAAGRESLISRHVPRTLFTGVNTATAVASYGVLPVGALLVGALGTTGGWLLALTGYAVVAGSYVRLRGGAAAASGLRGAGAGASHAASAHAPTDATAPHAPVPLVRLVLAAALGMVPVVALFTLAPEFAGAWLGDRATTAPLYAAVLVGGAGGFVLANTRRLPAPTAMVLAAAGLAVAAGGAWAPGLVLVGVGAGAAYLDLQTRLQHTASDPSQFAAAFAGLKVAAGVAVVGAPLVTTTAGLGAVPVVGALVAVGGAVVALGGAVVAVPAPSRLAQLAIREVIGVLFRTLVHVEVTNPHARHAGPAVIVSNHPHWLDGAVAVQADRSLRPVARWQRSRAARFAIWAGNCVVTTAGTDRDPRPAYEVAADHLRAGGRIWLAPEGGSHAATTLRPPRSGAVRMAAAANVPVQPLALHWADRYAGPDLRRWRPWRRAVVRVTWSTPVAMTGDVAADLDAMMRELAATAGLTLPEPAHATGSEPAPRAHPPEPAHATGSGPAPRAHPPEPAHATLPA